MCHPSRWWRSLQTNAELDNKGEIKTGIWHRIRLKQAWCIVAPSPGTCLGPKSLSSNVAAQKTFFQIGVSFACDCTKTAVKLKFSSWGHNKKLIFHKTCTLDNNGTLIEWRDLKHSVLGRLIFLFWQDTKTTTTTKKLFFILLPKQNFLPLNASQVCMAEHVFHFPNQIWLCSIFLVGHKIKQNKMKAMLTRLLV